MNLQQLLKQLKLVGVKFTALAALSGVNVKTIYSICGGRCYSQELESLLVNVIKTYYKEELEKIAYLKKKGCL